MRPLNETELKRLRDEFMIENTYHSNAIEGSTLTLRETAMILQDGITIAEKPIKEHLEAIGHRDAFEYVMSLADAKTDYEEMKRNMHIIEAIAEFHLRFEGIHPFIDGNGRTGRLILNLELIKSGLLPVNIKFADRRRYYDSFDRYYGDEHTPDALVKLIADYEAEELERHIKIIAG